jgi:transcriptional regulator with XRE-family HTH domain
MAPPPIGAVVRVLRTERGMTQREVAEAAECEANYVSKIERGRSQLTIDVLMRLADALGTEGWKILRQASKLDRKGRPR